MSINIIGANGSKLSLITENKIKNIFEDFETEYALLNEKYLSKCNSNIINRKCYYHYLKQLSYLFIKSDDINELIIYANKRNSFKTLYQHVKCVLKDFDLLHHLHNSLKKIDNKLNYHNTKFISNIQYVTGILSDYDNQEINKYIEQIQNILENINNEIIKFKNISTNNNHKIILNDYNSNEISNEFITNLKISLDDIIEINTKIYSQNKQTDNIEKLMTLINELTNILSNIYTLI